MAFHDPSPLEFVGGQHSVGTVPQMECQPHAKISKRIFGTWYRWKLVYEWISVYSKRQRIHAVALSERGANDLSGCLVLSVQLLP